MIKVSLVLLAGLAVVGLLRRQSAALRHWVLAATIACAAFTPTLEGLVPSWRMTLPSFGLERSAERLTLFIPLRLAESDAAGAAAGGADRPARSPVPVERMLAWIWMTGSAIGFAILSIGLLRLTGLARRARIVDAGPWPSIAADISRSYGLARPAWLLESDHPALLATWGVRQPKVILPRDANAWPADRIRIVLGHELAHVARRDWLVQMAGELLRCAYWFNPLAWIVCRRLRQESEQACDDAVLQLGVDGTDYAAHLLDVARALAPQRTTLFPAPAMARPSSLERRIRAMLNMQLDRSPTSRAAGLAIALALVTTTATVAGVVASAQSTSASFSGLLEDAMGKILPETTLVLSSAQNQQTFKTTSDSNGRFTFPAIPAGDYELVADRAGFDKAQGRVTLGAGQRLNRDVVLQVGSLEETIRVYAGPPAKPSAPRPPAVTPTDEFDPCSQSLVGGCITQPSKLRDVKPIYPQAKNDAGVGGKVVVEARIGTDGFMKDFRVVSGDREFAAAAIEAFRGWQFSQTRLDGVPVEVNMKVTTTFVVP